MSSREGGSDDFSPLYLVGVKSAIFFCDFKVIVYFISSLLSIFLLFLCEYVNCTAVSVMLSFLSFYTTFI